MGSIDEVLFNLNTYGNCKLYTPTLGLEITSVTNFFIDEFGELKAYDQIDVFNKPLISDEGKINSEGFVLKEYLLSELSDGEIILRLTPLLFDLPYQRIIIATDKRLMADFNPQKALNTLYKILMPILDYSKNEIGNYILDSKTYTVKH